MRLEAVLRAHGSGGAGYESEREVKVRVTFIVMQEEVWLRCGPAPETR